jgi:VWFA-related protein
MHPLLQATLLASLTASSLAQETLHTTSTLIVVPTLVQTSTKDVVYPLTADDFTLTDNGTPQKIKLEPTSTQPLSLVVLVQTGGAATREFEHYRNLETMLAALLEDGTTPSKNQVAIVNFDSKPEAASPFTSNVAEWTDAINHADPGDSGAAILDSLAYALRLLDSQPAANRRAILLLSRPTDLGSKTTLKEILRATGETNTAIYTLTFSPEKAAIQSALKDRPHLNPPKDFGAGPFQGYFDFSLPLALLLSTVQKSISANIATLTGGEAATFDNQHSLDDDLGTLTTHIRNRYLLTFQPATPKPGLHTLEVRLPRHPELTVSARTSYWSAEPEPPPAK